MVLKIKCTYLLTLQAKGSVGSMSIICVTVILISDSKPKSGSLQPNLGCNIVEGKQC